MSLAGKHTLSPSTDVEFTTDLLVYLAPLGMTNSDYDDSVVNELRRRLWSTAYKFAGELRDVNNAELSHIDKTTISGLELLTVLHIMEEETRHHWIEDKKTWNDILKSGY